MVMWFPVKDELNRGDWINARQELQENIRVKPDGYKEGRELEKGDQADDWTKPWSGFPLLEITAPTLGQYEVSLGVAVSQPLASTSVFFQKLDKLKGKVLAWPIRS